MTDVKRYNAQPFNAASGKLLVVADNLAAAISELWTRLAPYQGQLPWGDADPGFQFGAEYTRIEPVGFDALRFIERQVHHTGLALAAAAEIIRRARAGDEDILARLADYVPALAPAHEPTGDPADVA